MDHTTSLGDLEFPATAQIAYSIAYSTIASSGDFANRCRTLCAPVRAAAPPTRVIFHAHTFTSGMGVAYRTITALAAG